MENTERQDFSRGKQIELVNRHISDQKKIQNSSFHLKKPFKFQFLLLNDKIIELQKFCSARAQFHHHWY